MRFAPLGLGAVELVHDYLGFTVANRYTFVIQGDGFVGGCSLYNLIPHTSVSRHILLSEYQDEHCEKKQHHEDDNVPCTATCRAVVVTNG